MDAPRQMGGAPRADKILIDLAGTLDDWSPG